MKLRTSLLALFVFAAGPIAAEEHHDAGEHHAGGEHGHHKNLIGIFAGITHEGRREDHPALGIEYERLITEQFGLGVLIEHTFADEEFTVYALPVAWHLDRLKLFAAPGIEDTEFGDESLLRIGAEYKFDMDGYEIAPQLDIDFVDGEQIYVFGLLIGFPF